MTVLGTAGFADDMKKNHAEHGEMTANDHDMHDHDMVPDLPEGLALGHPVILVAGKSAKSVGGFLVIENTSDQTERLISANSDIARKTELHTHIIENDVARMRKVEGGFEIEAGGVRVLKRGGDHIMLMGLTEVPAVGDTVSLTLEFENAGEVVVSFEVMDAVKAGEMIHGTMDHGAMHKDGK
jgi:copper(I)-binding protein